ncbi:TetR/AcrR family transcriptional regulator [Schleiferilactobacillus harbinensis]|uniref:HTH tetR-type domain-containing protein n=1 Tax=Schleiferilactobacillus harbinensis TaxID=304207 RepID=A0A5P8M5C5_9LACO|nr:TetR/AcrR family transcriptional regulator [Schleiferilactobacillus harbinensis]QFR23679.1 hypothetical protein D1010_09820 [Schleiferilactobacillus harbinensis]
MDNAKKDTSNWASMGTATRRKMILDEFATEMRIQDYRDINISALATHLNIGKTMIFRSFPTKANLVTALVLRDLEAFGPTLVNALGATNNQALQKFFADQVTRHLPLLKSLALARNLTEKDMPAADLAAFHVRLVKQYQQIAAQLKAKQGFMHENETAQLVRLALVLLVDACDDTRYDQTPLRAADAVWAQSRVYVNRAYGGSAPNGLRQPRRPS